MGAVDKTRNRREADGEEVDNSQTCLNEKDSVCEGKAGDASVRPSDHEHPNNHALVQALFEGVLAVLSKQLYLAKNRQGVQGSTSLKQIETTTG
jgi:hypothetical protein